MSQQYQLVRACVFINSCLLACGAFLSFVEWNSLQHGYGNVVWSPFWAGVTSFCGFMAYTRKESKWAQAYFICMSFWIAAVIAVWALIGVSAGIIGGVACSQANNNGNPHVDHVCSSLLFGGLAIFLVVAVASIIVSCLCCMCGVSYYQGLRFEESNGLSPGTGRVIGRAQPVVFVQQQQPPMMHQQPQMSVQQAYPVAPQPYAPPMEPFPPPAAPVPGVFHK
eukprot:TRINITY_DN165_c0_g1_i3.p2 TRINITY_DN165_c0_g1~~TRINITY_DN165_c0_g1_i3.p2  ORF type:complete len:237 (+),score=59.03 TRINITY_DN165_c0_g1_i3:45-713(+)